MASFAFGSEAPTSCPLALCESFLSGGPCSLAAELFEAAAADPAFLREVRLSQELVERARVYVRDARLGEACPSSESFARRARRGIVADVRAAHPVLAAILWYARREMSLVFSGLLNEEALSLLRAGRHCLGRVEFQGSACYFEDAALQPDALAPLALCRGVRAISATQIPPAYPQAICAALHDHAPPSLLSLSLEFFPAFLGQQDPPQRWAARLPASLRHLSLTSAGRHFRTGLSDCIATCCPALASLSLNLYGPDDGEAEEAESAACIAALLPRLPALHSLSISDALLCPATARALCAMPALECLTLQEVFVRPVSEPVCRELAAGPKRLRSLHVSFSLRQDNGRALSALLAACGRSATLSSLSLCHSRFSTAALAACAAACPLQNLSVDHGFDLHGAEELARAAAGAAATLRELSLRGPRFASAENFSAACAALSACTRLERLDLNGGVAVSLLDDAALSELVELLGGAAPKLERITVCSLDVARPLTEAAVQRVERKRRREGAGPAWAVVRAGIEAAQERRVTSRSPSRLSSSLLSARLPPSVLRDVGAYLETRIVKLCVSVV
jgi:hypothetical protein